MALGFLLAMTLIVFVHEFGHFYVGRLCGIKVETFSIGFGKELFGFNDKHGTRWKFCLIPLGGYVKFFGDADESSRPDHENAAIMSEEEKKHSFFHKPIWARALTVLAGPFANFILATLIFAAVFMSVGKPIIAAIIDEVIVGGAAEKAELKAGDKVIAVDGRTIKSFDDMYRLIVINANTPLLFKVERGGVIVEKTVTPDKRERKDLFGNVQSVGLIGVKRTPSESEKQFVKMGLGTAIVEGMNECVRLVDNSFTFLSRIIRGSESVENLGGTIRIAHMTGKAAQLGFLDWVMLCAALSVSIGFFNLLPVPVLDGGHLLLYGIEALKGSPLAPIAQDYLFRFGFACLAALTLLTTFNDLKWLFKPLIK